MICLVVYAIGKRRVVGFSRMKENDGILGDRVGQLGESEEYWMGSMVVAPACVD
jgi:hypothetical protein